MQAIIAVSEDDTCEFDQKTFARENKLYVLFFSFSFFYIPIFMIGKNIGAAAATPAARVPTPMQFYAVFQSLSCRRHVDNSCSSLVHECRLQLAGGIRGPMNCMNCSQVQHRRGATMLANKPQGII